MEARTRIKLHSAAKLPALNSTAHATAHEVDVTPPKGLTTTNSRLAQVSTATPPNGLAIGNYDTCWRSQLSSREEEVYSAKPSRQGARYSSWLSYTRSELSKSNKVLSTGHVHQLAVGKCSLRAERELLQHPAERTCRKVPVKSFVQLNFCTMERKLLMQSSVDSL